MPPGGGPGNPNWHKGMASPNPHGPNAVTGVAKRSLALACQEAASDDEIAEWLLRIAVDGEWPEKRRKRRKRDGTIEERAEVKTTDAAARMAELSQTPPDATHRVMALKMFLERRNGQPMQAIALRAELEARSRVISQANDVIDLDELDAAAATVLEAGLTRALESVLKNANGEDDEDA